MRTLIATAVAAAGLMLAAGSAEAQFSTPFTIYAPAPSLVPADPRITATPYSARVYGYYRYYADRDGGPRYRRYRHGCDEWDAFWTGQRCGRVR
jgi:hypothetical protein